MNYLSGIRYVINNYIFTNNNEWKKIKSSYKHPTRESSNT